MFKVGVAVVFLVVVVWYGGCEWPSATQSLVQVTRWGRREEGGVSAATSVVPKNDWFLF